MSRAAYDIAGAAAELSVSERTIQRAIHAEEGQDHVPNLRARRLGKKYLISHEDLMAWFESLPVAS